MVFISAFIAHAPDADPEKHRAVVDSGKSRLFVSLVQNQKQALEVCKDLVEKEGIHSILLCPGFTHGQVAEIAQAVGPNVGVNVARGDGPSSKAVMPVLMREGFIKRS